MNGASDPAAVGQESVSSRLWTSGTSKREILLTWAALVATLIATVGAAAELLRRACAALEQHHPGAASGFLLLGTLTAFFVYGGIVYQLTRLGHFSRMSSHRPASRGALETLYDGEAPALAMLVPSYKEEPRVVMQALMSLALQDYPRKRVVLLIDDPPSQKAAEDLEALLAARALPGLLRQKLSEPAQRLQAARDEFTARRAQRKMNPRREAARLAGLYREAAAWCGREATQQGIRHHTDAFFVRYVLHPLRDDHLSRAEALQQAARRGGPAITEAEIAREYQRLSSLFTVEVSSFERKRYVNLSHEPNKAMNLNSYIGLMGGRFREEIRNGELRLVPIREDAEATLVVPDPTYVLTLDADSLLDPRYALTLVHLMEQPGNARLAVAQTPYSAIPGAPGTLERVAGATTDIQGMIHQGFTAYDATFWVGANALLRKTALEEIAVEDLERGFLVRRYIQDRTVIEDTESTVDLISRGWRLFNYQARLSYSATPPDFGALVIQRRRWANGGLIILPKLLRYLWHGGGGASEAFTRCHYLSSITAVNIGLLLLLCVPLFSDVESLWLPATAVPYFALYHRDLSLLGYRRGEVLRVYALNLLLIPVNLSGVMKSIQQALTRAKIPFARTPKVEGRTAVAPLYIFAEYAMLANWSIAAAMDFAGARWTHGAFTLVNSAFLAYAIAVFVGFRETAEDLVAAI
ncbi:MAG TPA: glycosyltransferase family 2 protein, partial [Myxococcaceae bacterium]|nr:glycosyltransferase family 2 protein [Myxococcaceae bacterium]